MSKEGIGENERDIKNDKITSRRGDNWRSEGEAGHPKREARERNEGEESKGKKEKGKITEERGTEENGGGSDRRQR